MKKKLCFVVQRYGEEINGGAEAYCRIYAEKLKGIYDISVLTTCALDYNDWSNHYNPGVSIINGVTVHRFNVDYIRNHEEFGRLTQKVYGNVRHTLKESDEWVRLQGPVSSGLINYLKNNVNDFDLVLFFTYLYYPTVEGIKYAKDKAVLIPFCHDEPPVYLKSFDALFTAPLGIIYNTEEEKAFVHRRFKNEKIPSVTTGIGLDIPPQNTYPNARKTFGLNKPFIVYMGRVDPAKGCSEMFEYFKVYKNKHGGDLQLVLMGKELIEIPKNKDVLSLGFVSEEEKYAVLKEAEMLVLPSHYESLSIVVLEAFAFEKPILVSGHSAVLKGHCLKSNGGLYFYDDVDFDKCLQLLMSDDVLRKSMGKNGKKYVDENYQWDVIIDKMKLFIEKICQGASAP